MHVSLFYFNKVEQMREQYKTKFRNLGNLTLLFLFLFQVLSGADAKDMKYFKISCNGSCKGINIRLDPPQVNEIEKGGDPDLCVRYELHN